MSSTMPPLPSNPREDAGPRILGATLTTTCMAIVVVLTRFYVRRFMIRAIGWDDVVMLSALLLSVTGEALVIVQINNGGGRHIGDVDPDNYVRGMRYNFITQPIYLWAICTVKMSVGLALLRIATEKKYRVTIYSIMGFMLFYTFGCFMTILLQCKQLDALWNPNVPRHCWDANTLLALSFTNVALNILTDLAFAIFIPIPMLWKLQMNSRTKGSIIAVLGLGVFACAAAIVKIPSLVQYGRVGDFLWDSRDITIWTITECNIGICAGSMPALKPLFKPILGSSYARRFTRSHGYAMGSEPKSTSARPAYVSSKNFAVLSSKDRSKDNVEDDETQSQASQKHLVEDNSYPLGVIEKTVTSTVTTVDGRSATSSPRLYSCHIAHAR